MELKAVFVAKYTDLKKAVLAYGKNMPRNNQFSGFFAQNKNEILPGKKSAQIFERFTQK